MSRPCRLRSANMSFPLHTVVIPGEPDSVCPITHHPLSRTGLPGAHRESATFGRDGHEERWRLKGLMPIHNHRGNVSVRGVSPRNALQAGRRRRSCRRSRPHAPDRCAAPLTPLQTNVFYSEEEMKEARLRGLVSERAFAGQPLMLLRYISRDALAAGAARGNSCCLRLLRQVGILIC